MRRFLAYIILLTGFLLAACDDFEHWTTSPSALLSFSTDTIHFDTIISGQGSATKTLYVFNDNKEGLRHISVSLKEGANSHFRVNVDGQYLTDGWGDDFEVRRRDSILVRVEVKLPVGGDAQIRHYEDQLFFTLESGLRIPIVLTADGMDVQIVRGKVVEADEVIEAGIPYQIFDSLVVRPGATLTINPGVTLLFHNQVSLQVHGSLQVKGTAEDPVVMRGDRIDRMFTNFFYDQSPNQWGGVHLYADSHDNVIDYCDIHSGNYGILCDSLTTIDSLHPFLTLRHSVVHNVDGPGLSLKYTSAQVIGCQISNALGNCVEVWGGDVLMAQSTIAQFYPFSAERQDALYLSNLDADEKPIPLHRAHFLNSVITGYADDVLTGCLAAEETDSANYLFDHCLLRTVQSEDSLRFHSIVYDNADLKPVSYHDHFLIFNAAYSYDFTPVDSSAITTAGDAALMQEYCNIDRLGRAFHVIDGKSECGAYAVASKKEE